MSGAWVVWGLEVALVLLVLGFGVRVLFDQGSGKSSPIERMVMRRSMRKRRREGQRHQGHR